MPVSLQTLVRAVCAGLGLIICVLWASAASAQDGSAHAEALRARPWAEAMRQFAALDRARPPDPGAVVFVGSSSIRLWQDLEGQFRNTVVVQRGFGGARLSDCLEHLDQLVIAYRPRMVLLYAGDNDLAEGATPREVFERFVTFAERVRERLSTTRLAFISIKPSPARVALLQQARITNRLIEIYARGRPDLVYIDVYYPMLDSDGLPRGELFAADRLHLNAAGYALWREVLAPHLRRDPGDEIDHAQRAGQHARLGPERKLSHPVADGAEHE